VFPYVAFRDRSPEWHDWQVIDQERLGRATLKECVTSVLDRARQHLAATPTAGWFDPRLPRPTAAEVDAVAALLRPDFEMFEAPRSRIRRLDEEIIRYTEEQFSALDAMQDNPRVVFEGAAGTGKTMLAIEASRRAASLGKRVLLICFNRALGRWLGHQMDGVAGVTTTTIHAHMLRMARVEARDDPEFWRDELPAAACDAALMASAESFDQLVIDEGQDLLYQTTLDYVDLLISGGLRRGRWQMFGDFAYQRIYDRGGPSLDKIVESRGIAGVKFRLTENCRNAPRIATYAGVLGGVPDVYRRVLRPDHGVNAHTKFYTTAEEQSGLLTAALEELAAEGFSGSNVAILSARAAGRCADSLSRMWTARFCGIDDQKPMLCRSGTIHAFKGLEAHAVVLTDIDGFGSGHDRDLFYVGASRAFDRVTVLAHERTRVQLTTALLEGDVRQ